MADYEYGIKAIPTNYAGVMFRSRLEAKWAAFFDLCGWPWEYEPFDLDGWTPDFLLKGSKYALVEVKPIDYSSNETAGLRQAKFFAEKAFYLAERIQERMIACGDGRPEILVIGSGPFSAGFNKWCLGAFALERWGGEDWADLFFGDTTPLDYAARYGSYGYRISGAHDGDHHLHPIYDATPLLLWRRAANLTQWKPPTPAPEATGRDIDVGAMVRTALERQAKRGAA